MNNAYVLLPSMSQGDLTGYISPTQIVAADAELKSLRADHNKTSAAFDSLRTEYSKLNDGYLKTVTELDGRVTGLNAMVAVLEATIHRLEQEISVIRNSQVTDAAEPLSVLAEDVESGE